MKPRLEDVLDILDTYKAGYLKGREDGLKEAVKVCDTSKQNLESLKIKDASQEVVIEAMQEAVNTVNILIQNLTGSDKK